MERNVFLAWLSEIDNLSVTQKVEAGEVLAGRPAGETSVATVEMGVGEDQTCLHRKDFWLTFGKSLTNGIRLPFRQSAVGSPEAPPFAGDTASLPGSIPPLKN